MEVKLEPAKIETVKQKSVQVLPAVKSDEKYIKFSSIDNIDMTLRSAMIVIKG